MTTVKVADPIIHAYRGTCSTEIMMPSLVNCILSRPFESVGIWQVTSSVNSIDSVGLVATYSTKQQSFSQRDLLEIDMHGTALLGSVAFPTSYLHAKENITCTLFCVSGY